MIKQESAQVFHLKGLKHFEEVQNEIQEYLDDAKPERITRAIINEELLIVFYIPKHTITSSRRDKINVMCTCHVRSSLAEWLRNNPLKITHCVLNKDYLFVFYEIFDIRSVI